MVQLCHICKQVVAHVVAQKAAARRQDHEPAKGAQEVDLALLCSHMLVEVRHNLTLDLGHVACEAERAQARRSEAQLLKTYSWRRVEHDALAKHGPHELVNLALIKFSVGGTKECLGSLRTHAPRELYGPADIEREHIAVLRQSAA